MLIGKADINEKIKACEIFVLVLSCRINKILIMPVKITTTPIYLVRHANATDSDKNKSDFTFFFSKYIEIQIRYKTTKKTNGNSDQAMKATVISGIETSKDTVPRNARDGDKFLRNNNPDRYRDNPKKIALTKLADAKGSTPNTKSITPKIAG